jgi:hypothetical protein
MLNGIGDMEVNAFQTGAQMVAQKSFKRELWPGRNRGPMEVTSRGGRSSRRHTPLQVIHQNTGYLVNSHEECAKRMLHLRQSPNRANQLGKQGRQHERRNFLIPRYLKDYIRIFRAMDTHTRKLYVPSSAKPIAETAGASQTLRSRMSGNQPSISYCYFHHMWYDFNTVSYRHNVAVFMFSRKGKTNSVCLNLVDSVNKGLSYS